ncbi:hypothetical protein [Agrobacterium rosae]|uniref:hypothetical protein n=1 Tax=Agrobacterium rosae TaxID=1972867 RepID=UPI003A805EE3
MFLYRITCRFVAVATVFSIAVTAVAAEDFGSRRNFGHHQATVGSNGLPSVIPRIGTYSGAISALRVRGNGNYFAIDNGLSRAGQDRRAAMPVAPKARIIHVDAQSISSACAYEKGVCVIRP